MLITNCTVDHKQNPLGYTMDIPVFGWTVEEAKGTIRISLGKYKINKI